MTLLPHYKKVISTDPDVLAFAEIFKDFKLQYIEQSVKISPGSVSRDRAMFAFYSDKIRFSKIESILRDLKFPASSMYEIEKYYYKSIDIGMAIEKSDGKINYRIYFEHLLHESKWIEMTKNLKYTYQAIHSFKWNYSEEGVNCTAYNTVLEPNGLVALMEIKNTKTTFVPECVSNKMKAYGNTPNSLGMYLVTDSATQRKAVDLNFGFDVLYNRDLSKDLHTFSKKNLENILALYDDKQIHHVSIGMGKNDEPYVTLYYLIHDPERGI
jgi:hypothetical protein